MKNKEALRDLIPINTFSDENFEELAAKTRIEKVPKGTVIFREGESDNQAIYLLEGELSLVSKKTSSKRRIIGGTDRAKYALAQLKPRHVTGKTKKDSVIAWVDGVLLDRLLTWDQVSGIEVIEVGDEEHSGWMLQMLRSTTFENLPPENAFDMFSRMETIPVKAGDVIVKQGEPGDYYYLIQEGKCTVSQKNSAGKVTIVNQLLEGDQFGEEALISDAPRNATIMMLTDGSLMRLAKKDFLELLRAPLIHWIGQKETETMLAEGAVLLDVRTEAEYQRGAIRSSRNIPLYRIREAFKDLDPAKKYVLYCQTGSRSAVATFMFSQNKLEAYSLKGGLTALQHRPEVGGG